MSSGTVTLPSSLPLPSVGKAPSQISTPEASRKLTSTREKTHGSPAASTVPEMSRLPPRWLFGCPRRISTLACGRSSAALVSGGRAASAAPLAEVAGDGAGLRAGGALVLALFGLASEPAPSSVSVSMPWPDSEPSGQLKAAGDRGDRRCADRAPYGRRRRRDRCGGSARRRKPRPRHALRS